MKIMKVLGVVVGIHLFAFMLIFANPGCSSTSKPAPAPVDTVAKSEAAPAISVPGLSAAPAAPISAAPIAFNPDAPASAGDGIRFTPTRPGSAAASTLVAEPVADVVPASTYVVKSGDSLWTIAKKNNLTTAELAAANNLKTGAVLHQGQKLLIPGKAAPKGVSSTAAATTKATVAAPKQSAESISYTVKSGESLSIIAKNFGVKQGDIAVANNITDPQKIRAGMVLTIPGWKGADKNGKPAAKSSTPSPTTKPATTSTGKPLFGDPVTPDANPVPVIGAGSGTPEIPLIKIGDAPAGTQKP